VVNAPIVLALDVDGVLLDPARGGTGPWTRDLEAQHGIREEQLQEVFFRRVWGDVMIGARPIEPALRDALIELGSTAEVEEVLECWFAADFCVRADTMEAVRAWSTPRDVRVVLTTNQERRRAEHLRDHLGAEFTVSSVYFSALLGAAKPEPTFFVAASDRLQRDFGSERVVFVDDALENVEAARRHGWIAVHADAGVGWHHEVDVALAELRGADGR
jgi:putative hydrolase of the HAD superfamily